MVKRQQASEPNLRDRDWVRGFVEQGASVAELARAAGVSDPTARSWMRRHGVVIPTPGPVCDVRRRYEALGSIKALAEELEIAPETARQRLIAARVDLKRPGRQEGVHVVDVDVKDLKRRRDGGQSLRSIAAEVGIDWRTVKKLLGEQGTTSKGNKPVQKG